MRPTETIHWDDTTRSLLLIDQTKLPLSYQVIRCRSVERLITAIRRLEVRGAPALGVAGAYGVVLATLAVKEKDFHPYFRQVERLARTVADARPTAVNLSWAVTRVLAEIRSADSIREVRRVALVEAAKIADEDAAACHAIGDHGAALLPDSGTVLTHCNAGALACREWGTALGVIRSAVLGGKQLSVIACETRPLLQGARLTAWELMRDHIPVTVIPDSAAAFLMRRREIDCVIVGADRITSDAVFNKIGTYMHAVCANAHAIPFYVAAPSSTFDHEYTEDQVTIEERDRDELAYYGRHATIPEGVPVRNPAFDATPLSLVSAIITENGVILPAATQVAGKRRVI